ncbi:Uma2 family endonuclease [Sphaerospermopsis aphanizomenoides BCCUSP55]|uniref:Uma2 family endonuclease n=1 Tax=Sphaerospermopsis aphanizomenoides TaxID=459663 RepID=UPI000A8263EC|nr:Uma2 family endonuclease [Sphaerospermopsis aphanizomenoides]MBK1987128.1 Uma2 family endonuclease [Sphaerospermopsis aphanizomenoides BCCUSP55]
MVNYHLRECLPSSAELPDSDDTPVDNELQNLIPNLLEAILALAWNNRNDWFFGVDMGIYYAPSQPALVPDGFLSLGVERFIGEEGRLSYVLWEEDNIPPIFALEVVSKTYGGEYEKKKIYYAKLGILYYAIYVPNRQYRRKRQPLEIYRLENSEYILQPNSRVWMPEIGLALGRERGTYLGRTREWLYWYDEQERKLLTPEELAQQEKQRAEQELLKSARLAQKLRDLGFNPEEI